ncbi:MAG: hypothetical protein ACFE0P_01170 [Oceanicaulis sp.]
MAAGAWWRDFSLEGRSVRVLKTGALVPVEPGVIGEVIAWLRFHLSVGAAAPRPDGPSVWFAPDRPRPWYLIAPAARLAGLRIADTPERADLGFFFEDATIGTPPSRPGLVVINAACRDVSKSHVSKVFEQVSGRALAVDPELFHGPVAAKSETNGAHDGRVVQAPCAAAPGLVYQRLIDTLAEDGMVEDLRCPTVDGEIPVVFLKRRPLATRFANSNAEVRKLSPQDVFSAEERGLIKRFCTAMGLDWGGIDVLRDRRDGLIWIVDVNKTDMGPPTALPLAEKLAATRALARALRAYADRLAGAGGQS